MRRAREYIAQRRRLQGNRKSITNNKLQTPNDQPQILVGKGVKRIETQTVAISIAKGVGMDVALSFSQILTPLPDRNPRWLGTTLRKWLYR